MPAAVSQKIYHVHSSALINVFSLLPDELIYRLQTFVLLDIKIIKLALLGYRSLSSVLLIYLKSYFLFTNFTSHFLFLLSIILLLIFMNSFEVSYCFDYFEISLFRFVRSLIVLIHLKSHCFDSFEVSLFWFV